MAERNWGAIDPTTIAGFDALGEREQKAVRNTLSGIQDWQTMGEKPPPIGIRTSSGPFNIRAYADVLHKIGIGIGKQELDEKIGVVTFQPKPYDSSAIDEMERLRETLDTREGRRKLVEELAELQTVDQAAVDFLRRHLD